MKRRLNHTNRVLLATDELVGIHIDIINDAALAEACAPFLTIVEVRASLSWLAERGIIDWLGRDGDPVTIRDSSKARQALEAAHRQRSDENRVGDDLSQKALDKKAAAQRRDQIITVLGTDRRLTLRELAQETGIEDTSLLGGALGALARSKKIQRFITYGVLQDPCSRKNPTPAEDFKDDTEDLLS